ncbi:hypothetical protein [Rhizobium sp. BK176]|uniref:hypothetical protein n=1 Tax=Rhizobium sp. BK176 TaxID=2587071 RepID=UPI0021697FC7|nr:hypothetical protein [Rhizobium sp. BK176]MCS4088890.1 hypothetical protein [Rhizobium sp. BK176]
MTSPANDNLSLTATFRDKVFSFYMKTKILPCSADLIATHYVSAMLRQGFNADRGPVLPGCDRFGNEASPRDIIQAHARARLPNANQRELLAIVDDGITAAAQEISKPS